MQHRRILAISLVAFAASVGVSACGADDSDSPTGNGTDLAFAQEMATHHQAAIDMAKTAKQKGQSAYVTTLADNIITSQQGEIAVLNATKDDMTGLGVKPADLGLADDMSGMNMDDDALASADPFDREFIDMMIPHHQGAIRMARVELNEGSNPALKQMARDIIDAQSTEIREMNAFRAKNYGSASPAGGVPADPQDTPTNMPGMDHG